MESHIQAKYDHWIKLFICLLVVMIAQVHGVHITRLHSALAKGAACLDGSPPAYYYIKGFGEGSNNWLVQLEGGGWCGSDEWCIKISKSHNGSTKNKSDTMTYGQIFSQDKAINPDFYNWNIVIVSYCDGSSFMSNVVAIDPKTNLTRRGARIFNVVMEDLLAKGMKDADNAILAGGSAGGLATILHCDGFRTLIPNASRVKCLSDSGFFLHAKDLPGANIRENAFANTVKYHGLAKFLPASCTSKMNASWCMFPENLIRDIRTPLFLLESAFDVYQLSVKFIPACPTDVPTWKDCVSDFNVCTLTQLQTIKDFRAALIKTLREISNSPSIGMFVHSCPRHGHFYDSGGWNNLPSVGNKTIVNAIGDWFFDRGFVQEIDTQHDAPQHCSKKA
ncbi:hypothetical protein BUALT_Bualt03G0197500 [Buddleja alternifolia]|uniref:Pectin acetylesterase n=1 Tax=Buddleja alternifolia TaxID=168488 RepID=A0AAV6XV69_9LAMI|nr:hypothetical protein BUALT_Bualt03G0197500 [Buddleja alternifolia]